MSRVDVGAVEWNPEFDRRGGRTDDPRLADDGRGRVGTRDVLECRLEHRVGGQRHALTVQGGAADLGGRGERRHACERDQDGESDSAAGTGHGWSKPVGHRMRRAGTIPWTIPDSRARLVDALPGRDCRIAADGLACATLRHPPFA